MHFGKKEVMGDGQDWMNRFLVSGVIVISFLIAELSLSVLAGFNYTWMYYSIAGQGVLLMAYCLFKSRVQTIIQREVVVILIAVLFSVIVGVTYNPYTVEMHDQGLYAGMAALFTQHVGYELEGDQFSTYGGFDIIGENRATPGRVPAYSAYLSLFFFFFGQTGFGVGNSLLLFFSLLCMYEVGKSVFNTKVATMSMVLFTSSYTLIYFAKQTFGENLLMFLFWGAVFLFFKWQKELRSDFLICAVAMASLIVLVRIEGIAYIVMFVLTVIFTRIYSNKIKNDSVTVASKGRNIVAFIFVGLIVLTVGVYLFSYAGANYSSNVASSITDLIGSVDRSATPSFESLPFNFFIFTFVFSILSFYKYDWGLFLTLFLAAVIPFWKLGHKKWGLLFLSAPAAYFVINPSIALYHPWFMRRFFAVFLPIIILFGVDLLVKLIKYHRSIMSTVMCGLIVGTMLGVSPVILYREGVGLPAGLTSVSELFSEPKQPIIFVDHYCFENYGVYYFLYENRTTYLSPIYNELDLRLGDKSMFNESKLNEVLARNKKVYLATCMNKASLDRTFFGNHVLRYIGERRFSFEVIRKEADVRMYLWIKSLSGGYFSIVTEMSRLPPSTRELQTYAINVYEIDLSKAG